MNYWRYEYNVDPLTVSEYLRTAACVGGEYVCDTLSADGLLGWYIDQATEHVFADLLHLNDFWIMEAASGSSATAKGTGVRIR